MSAPREYCFVLMPFGTKKDANGRDIDFDKIYKSIIHPAIEQCDLAPIRADEEMAGGSIHKQMFERLMLCPYAVADLTTANANVFYELGIRHSARKLSTVMVFAKNERLPFDLAVGRAFPYEIDAAGEPTNVAPAVQSIAAAIQASKNSQNDSLVYEFVSDFSADISRLKTDLFHDTVAYGADLQRRVGEARGQKKLEPLVAVEESIEDFGKADGGALVDLMLGYRGVEAWQRMIDIIGRMRAELRNAVMVREQYAFALNRLEKGSAQAEQVLRELIEKRGPSSETYGLLGRVYKDRWSKLRKSSPLEAEGTLDAAIEAYTKGFQADWRDAYPGVNAVTLMEIHEPPDERRLELLPVVRYAATRRAESAKADYWDWATLVELAVIGRDREQAVAALKKALPMVRESWEPKSTLGNLALIDEARAARGEQRPEWIGQIMTALEKKGS